MRTFEGRPLLPGEVPVIPYYRAAAERSRRMSHRAAAALFEDLSLEAATAAARREDRWQSSLAADDDVTEKTPVDERWAEAGGADDEGVEASQMEPVWGEASQMIERWFESGEVLAARVAAAPQPVEESEPSLILGWVGSLCERVRRVWGRPSVEVA
jgi:hypothetical protein